MRVTTKVIYLDCFDYHIGALLIRYLGLPLSPKKLSYSICIPLIGKIRAEIQG